MEQYKTCTKCQQVQSLDSFHKSADNKDGKKNICKACTKTRDQARYLKNAEANRQRGLNYYYANAERYAAKSAKKYAENRDEIAAKKSATRRENLWHHKALERASYARNADKKREYGRRYSKANPDKSRVRNSRRRARLAEAICYAITPKELQRMYSQPCSFCSSTGSIDLDHKIPLSRGGSHGIGNLMPLCDNCNSTKYNKTIMEWRIYRIRIGLPLPIDRDKK